MSCCSTLGFEFRGNVQICKGCHRYPGAICVNVLGVVLCVYDVMFVAIIRELTAKYSFE